MRLCGRLLGLCFGIEATIAALLVSEPGETAVIPSWDLESTEKVDIDLKELFHPGKDTSSWHHVDTSRCTLMGCLLETGVYREDDLFYSDRLQTVNATQFKVPWIYRKEFSLSPEPGQYYHLVTHGISSSADLYVNGEQIATRKVQAGAYVGSTYDITKVVKPNNALVVQVHPTDYNYDFALGFVDWNPYPPDNGTGVWRNIEIKQTGPVALGPLRVTTDVTLPVENSSAVVTLKSTAQNLADHEVTVKLVGNVSIDGSSRSYVWTESTRIPPLATTELLLSTTLERPEIWWPKQWGDQPLYKGEISALVDQTLSDTAEGTFGIRQVTSEVNSHNDTMFFVNGYPFQVIGSGYSADMFLRWDSVKFSTQAKLMLDLGHNTVRLEGKNEHPELYDIADRVGLMVLAGWECCDKWEAWTYNEDLAVKSEWADSDYATANRSMYHEALMQQGHPSMLAYLVGSDYWPDDKAAQMYDDSLKAADWQLPIIASASMRGFPKLLGPSGLKMDGPYDWVPPNYWYDVHPSEDRLGAAFGFGSELGAGVGTPEISSLKKFLSKSDMDDLWKKPEKGLYHMSTNVSSFYDRKIYNDALWERFGEPSSLDDYLLKAQIMDYEATRAQFEGFSALWGASRPATGLIYWMMNNAWPSLHWNLFDYYMHPAGSYFGAKVGGRTEHVAYDYHNKTVYLINRSLNQSGRRTLAVDAIDMDGDVIYSTNKTLQTEVNVSKGILDLSAALDSIEDVVFLRLVLFGDKKKVLSRNVYWLAETIDTLNWDDSDWFYTPVDEYANFTALDDLQTAKISTTIKTSPHGEGSEDAVAVVLENHSSVPAFFIRLNLVDKHGEDILPVIWSDNYVTLWPHEKLELQVEGKHAAAVQVSGKNVAKAEVPL
ncbi:glycoside hydrolase family 2 protein [Xylariaceae sp. FL0662B]|nr:glycoside hydrolase family 2 protein [Xylariaceae sp. FL0662B]